MKDSTKVIKRKNVVPETERLTPETVFNPQVDIVEKPDSFVIVADLPGVQKENVDLALDNGVLTLTAKPDTIGVPEMNLTRREYEVGSFHRCFSDSGDLDIEKAEATMKDGVLRVVVPKSEQQKTRSIEIKDN